MHTNLKSLIAISILCGVGAAQAGAEDIPITGNVEPKCAIFADTSGVYGNPTPNELSTDSADGNFNPPPPPSGQNAHAPEQPLFYADYQSKPAILYCPSIPTRGFRCA